MTPVFLRMARRGGLVMRLAPPTTSGRALQASNELTSSVSAPWDDSRLMERLSAQATDPSPLERPKRTIACTLKHPPSSAQNCANGNGPACAPLTVTV